jgi:hypothetical protein
VFSYCVSQEFLLAQYHGNEDCEKTHFVVCRLQIYHSAHINIRSEDTKFTLELRNLHIVFVYVRLYKYNTLNVFVLSASVFVLRAS